MENVKLLPLLTYLNNPRQMLYSVRDWIVHNEYFVVGYKFDF
jgi:hypothetical protein